MRQKAISSLSTARKALQEQSRNMHLKSAMQFWMYGSLHQTINAIINLPATVENAMPHVYASQVEYMSKHMKYRDEC